ncbi:MAG: hypothetical protein REJ24_00595 [Rhodocyclaceae bacterium]|nr:hypothetical protein [Pseudomonadota bacterium]MDQ7971028.1 hypothetical protein [Rhodocyclaceae bacterium]MDQ7999539.1 hypothetical protein [Pseudomonadota bacterium]MDQ8018331.1 hypothetical protein [Pseudomonadota bacterium]
MNFFDFQHNPASVQVEELEFAVVTARRPDRHIDTTIGEVLRVIHDKMGMHFVFASEVVVGAAPEPGRELSEGAQWYLFDSAFCRDVVMPHWIEADAPLPTGCFTVPVVLASGRVVGVIYAPRFAADAGREQQLLRQVELSSQLIARRIDERSRPVAAPRITGETATITPLVEAQPQPAAASVPQFDAIPRAWALAA